MHDSQRQDPWRTRLSEYVDGELASGEREALEAHLATCDGCTEVVRDLRELVKAARELPDRAPAADAWLALRAALEPRAPVAARPHRSWAALLAFAAGVLVTLGAWLAFASIRDARDGRETVAAGGSYMLLLHEPEGFENGTTPVEHAAIVERYASWAHELGARCLAGDELASGGWELRAGSGGASEHERASGPGIGGYFLVQAADASEALRIARTCPHLERGGWIELRPIQAH